MDEVNLIDPTFDYAHFSDPIHFGGIGGIGSHVARNLAKGGFRGPMHLWDGDRVEAKNLLNQTYDREHIGLLKTTALSQQVALWRGVPAVEHAEFLGPPRPLQGIVFLCVDTMSARWTIWQNCIKGNTEIPLFIETRMDGVNLLIHTLDPCNKIHQEDWEHYWYPDHEAFSETAGCGGPIAVLPSASMAADLAVWQLMRYAAIKAGRDDCLDNQIRVRLRPLSMKAYCWE